MWPNSVFITSFINFKSNDVDNAYYIETKLKRKKCSCEIYGGKLIDHGAFNKIINHTSLREHKYQ